MTTSLMPVLQNMKTGNDGTECIEKHSTLGIPLLPHVALIRLHTANQNGHSAGTQSENPMAQMSDGHLLRLRMLNGADSIQAAPKASDAAEHTKHICSRPRASLPKCFTRPTVRLVCSCLKDPWPFPQSYSRVTILCYIVLIKRSPTDAFRP